MSDLIRREDVDKAIRKICDLCGEDKKNNGVMCGACNLDSFIREFDDIPSAEPEEPERIIKIGQRSGKTLESAIDYLRSTGWLQEHDRILTESAEPERTAKAVEHDASVTDTDGYKYHRSEYLCGACKKKVLGGDEYCSHCGCRLDWNEDIPMEYFESGGK